MNRKDHWENIYSTKTDAEMSWTQAQPHTSLALIREACTSGRIIDIGGGTSVLADNLLDAGYDVAVLDIASAALDRARKRLGAQANRIRWIAADVTATPEVGVFDLWHDRAVFHFLTAPADRAAYVELMTRSVPLGGHAIIATFALDGPEKCSGLEVRRYDSQLLASELGAQYELIKNVPEFHQTPWGKPQLFQYGIFKRI